MGCGKQLFWVLLACLGQTAHAYDDTASVDADVINAPQPHVTFVVTPVSGTLFDEQRDIQSEPAAFADPMSDQTADPTDCGADPIDAVAALDGCPNTDQSDDQDPLTPHVSSEDDSVDAAHLPRIDLDAGDDAQDPPSATVPAVVTADPHAAAPDAPLPPAPIDAPADAIPAPVAEAPEPPLKQAPVDHPDAPLLVDPALLKLDVTESPAVTTVHTPDIAPAMTPPAAVTAPPKLDDPTAAIRALLRQYIRNALQYNPQLLQSEAEGRGADYRIAEASGNRYPKLSASMNVSNEKQNRDEAPDGRFRQKSGQLRWVVPLFDESIYAQIAQRKSAALSADWRTTDVREQLMMRTVELYVELIKASRLLALAQDNLAVHRQYVAQIKEIALLDVGRSADIASAVARTSLAEAVITSRLAKLEGLRSAWRQVTGLAVPPELLDVPPAKIPEQLEHVVQRALNDHPVLRQAQAEIAVARDAVALARSAYGPKLNAELTSRKGKDWGGVQGDQSSVYAGMSFEWSLFNGFSDRYATLAAAEGVQAATFGYDRMRDELRVKVEQAWYDLQAAAQSLRSFDDYAKNARLMVETTRSQFKIGRKSLLEVLNAENELFTARSNIETTVQDLVIATWRLHSFQGRVADELELAP